MSSDKTTEPTFLALPQRHRNTIAQRIERRQAVLREWLAEGIPPGKVIPPSLAAARRWEDVELAIEAIASPNEFTKTHPLHGREVSNIAALLTALEKKFGRPKRDTRPPAPAEEKRFDQAMSNRLLQTISSQWHEEREMRLSEKRRADSAEARSGALLEDLKLKDKIISDLRRELSKKSGLRLME